VRSPELPAATAGVLATEAGGSLYAKRQTMVEPVFADTKFNPASIASYAAGERPPDPSGGSPPPATTYSSSGATAPPRRPPEKAAAGKNLHHRRRSRCAPPADVPAGTPATFRNSLQGSRRWSHVCGDMQGRSPARAARRLLKIAVA
jgi:hypothetical protein